MPRFNPYNWPFKYQSRFVYDKKVQHAYVPLIPSKDKFFLNFLRYLKNSSFISYIKSSKLGKIIEKEWVKRDPDIRYRQYEIFIWIYKLQWIIFWTIILWYLISIIKTLVYIVCIFKDVWIRDVEPSFIIPLMKYLLSVQWGINILCFICCFLFSYNFYLFYKVSTGIMPWYFRYIFVHIITLYPIFYIFSYF
jgi:hypothetical protein